MYTVICTLQNASFLISGVAFTAHPTEPETVITVEPVPAELAARFKNIPGYQILDAEPPAPAKPPRARKPAPADAAP